MDVAAPLGPAGEEVRSVVRTVDAVGGTPAAAASGVTGSTAVVSRVVCRS